MVNKKILIIDDEAAILDSVRRFLNDEGYTTIGALSGDEGIHLALRHNPDLIILDVNMPGMDGIETLKKLREHAALERTAVIMFTMRHEADSIVRCMVDHGALDYVVKPFQMEELLERLQVNLEARKKQLEKMDHSELKVKIKKHLKLP
jgi:two-component system, cell cycle response regulator